MTSLLYPECYYLNKDINCFIIDFKMTSLLIDEKTWSKVYCCNRWIIAPNLGEATALIMIELNSLDEKYHKWSNLNIRAAEPAERLISKPWKDRVK